MLQTLILLLVQAAAAAGDFSWHPTGLVPALENREGAPMQAVEIEWRGR